MIDQAHGSCLNQQSDHVWTNILTKDTTKYLESDCDPQLLIYVPFKQNVKINSICFVAPSDGKVLLIPVLKTTIFNLALLS